MSQVELTSLGESCEFFNGKAHEKSIDENGKYIVVNSKFISQEGRVVKRTKEQMFPLYKGDIVMVMSDVPNGKALAKCFIIDQDDTYSLNQRICCIRSKEFDTKYLYYQLNRHEHFLAFNNGENQTNLRKDDILACPLIKPSMEEQQRMVSELDEAYKKIQLAKNNIEKNLLNAADLFQAELNRLIEKEDYEFEVKPLGDLVKVERGSSPRPIQKYLTEGKEGVNWIKIGDVGENDKYVTSTKQKITKEGALKSRFVDVGDFILSNSMSFGRPYIMKIQGYIHDGWFVLRLPKNINPDYFWYLLSSQFVNSQFKKLAAGAIVQNISGDLVKQALLPIPSLENQLAIVNTLDKLSIQVNELINRYKLRKELVDELQTGISKRAFENELIEAE
jgi:type I restriction enzyme S subunit